MHGAPIVEAGVFGVVRGALFQTGDAGVVDEDVEPAMAVEQARHRTDPGHLFAHVQPHPAAGQALGRGRAALLVDVADDHERPFGDEGLGDGLADASRRTRHQGHLVLQSGHRASFESEHARHRIAAGSQTSASTRPASLAA